MHRVTRLIIGLIVFVVVTPAPGQQAAAKKTPVPSPNERKAAAKKVRETFADEFKSARTGEQKWTLAAKLAKDAVDAKADLVSKYTFAMEAIDLYVAVGDVLSAFRTVDELAPTFDLHPIQTKSDLFKKAAKEAKAVPLKRMMALVGMKLAGDSAAVEEYQVAKDIASLALALAKPSRDTSVVKRATEQQARYADLLKQWQKVVEARKALQTETNDAEANEIVGRYLCLARQNWAEGLPFLVKGFTVDLKALADADLKTGSDVPGQVKTANQWWDFAERKKAKDPEKLQLMPRIAYWYERAVPGLSGVEKVEAEKRLEAAYEAMSGRSFRKIMEFPANAIQSTGTVDCSVQPHVASIGKTFDYSRSWLLSLQFSPPDLAGGWHMVMFWGDGQAGKDPLWLRQDGDWLNCAVEDIVGERGQGIASQLTAAQINDWVDIKFVHDSISQELELYVNHRLVRKEALTMVPRGDPGMPLVLGGTGDQTSQRFRGKVRNVWMGNIK